MDRKIIIGMILTVTISLIAGGVGYYIGIEDTVYSNKEIINLYQYQVQEQQRVIKQQGETIIILTDYHISMLNYLFEWNISIPLLEEDMKDEW